MKRKTQPKSESVVGAEIIAPEILALAELAVTPDRAAKAIKCSVCGAETTIAAAEPLCWVCRRLKISAWREIEQQMPAQE